MQRWLRGFLAGAAIGGVLWGLIACDQQPKVEQRLGIQTVYEYYAPPQHHQPARHFFLYPTGEAKLYIGTDSIQMQLSLKTLDTLARLLQQVRRWNQEFLVAGDFAVFSITRIKPDGIESLRKAASARDLPPGVAQLFDYFDRLSARMRQQFMRQKR